MPEQSPIIYNPLTFVSNLLFVSTAGEYSFPSIAYKIVSWSIGSLISFSNASRNSNVAAIYRSNFLPQICKLCFQRWPDCSAACFVNRRTPFTKRAQPLSGNSIAIMINPADCVMEIGVSLLQSCKSIRYKQGEVEVWSPFFLLSIILTVWHSQSFLQPLEQLSPGDSYSKWLLNNLHLQS